MPVMKPPAVETSQQQQSTCAIKPSLSMTSLPPPNGQHESGELARLRIDRPYHSLKKKRDSEREIWRRSWESGHSHSSCSLHSNATNAGSGTGKDDFWAALQTNYNYIMDTNLIDSCREARGECDGSAQLADQQVAECSEKSIFQTSKSQGSVVDPRRLRRWLREMENRIEKSPSLSEAMKMKPGELQHRLTEHSDLYREIVSQARVVGACIRTAEKEASEEAVTTDKSTSPASSSSRRGDGNLKGLERRYHLLYLKAFEVQCMLESLLGRRGSPSPDVSRSQSDTDEEPVAKQARLSSLSSICGFNSRRCLYQDNDENRSDDEWGNPLAQAAGFEADSEGSDCEVTQKPTISSLSSNSNSGTPFSSLTLPDIQLQQPTAPASDAKVDQAVGTMDTVDTVDAGEMTTTLVTQVMVAEESPKAKTPQKRSRKVDISKFNRSNRKSKNCAIFYFRHLDTDGEQKGFSGSEAFKSSEPSTDEEWYYTNNGAAEENNETQNGNHHHDDEEPNHTLVSSPVIPSAADTIEAKQDCVTPVVESTTKRAIKCSKESIHQLVLDAENLIREETTKKSCSALAEVMLMSSSSSSRRKCEKKMMHNPKIKRVQEWLEHQPTDVMANPPSVPTTDCEASGEYTESDREITARDSDTSEGLADSVATCLQGGEANSNSQATSTEVIGGSAEPLPTGQLEIVTPGSVSVSGRVVMRGKRRNSDRPWSVSSLSQLTQTMGKRTVVINNQLATFSISESALHTLSAPLTPGGPATGSIGNSDSKSSLKKHRRLRMKKRSIGRKSDSGSDGAPVKSLVKSESFSGQSNFVQEQLSLLTISRRVRQTKSTSSEMESEEDGLAKPTFRLGSVTNVFPSTALAPNLGSLAALANYNGACIDVLKTHVSEDLSSEQAWDNYQEKYNSENYSEGLDSDAARRLLEFGDDYRNFLDSQSDCCSSSLSAANNLDSLSPPRYRKQLFSSPDCKSPAVLETNAHASESNAIRRRRALEYAEYERRRRRYSDDRRKSFESSHSSSRLSPKNGKSGSLGGSTDAVMRRKQSESDSSAKRRSGGRLSGSFRPLSSTSESSSGGSDSEAEVEMRNLLSQSRQRLEHTEALRVRRHLLRPEDYAEIIATCRDNVHCLEAVLRGPSVTVLSTSRCQETRELLSSWESLLNWSETASVARQLQEEMSVLKGALNRIGNRALVLDSEAAIQDAIEELQEEKTKLHGHRSTMLKLNASVHSWLTRQELEMSKYSAQSHILGAVTLVDATDATVDLERTITCPEGEKERVQQFFDTELHALLKDNVSDMYGAWDEADHRINLQLESLVSSLQTWKQLESGLVEFQEALGKDKGALKGLRGALESGRTTPVDLAHDVKEVAKLLSEKVEMTLQSKLQSDSVFLHPSTAILYHGKSSSNGSLSDSGISDGGCGSDGGLSERERRLGTLRRLAKQLENALAPGSAALQSIFRRMEAAESELKQLQDTCRELIVRTTAVTQKAPSHGGSSEESEGHKATGVQKKKSSQSKRKNKRRSPQSSLVVGSPSAARSAVPVTIENAAALVKGRRAVLLTADGEPDDPDGGAGGCLEEVEDEGEGKKQRWAWRVARIAIPVQIALVSLFCAACFLEPHCCDAINNFSMSFTPQLKYIRGPPPI
ncbi:klarsicht protein [Phlebotomus argentipes]|uniref:klarsicht protein n=1 Tax=Phlebotomus argentipes TaxID=94469 RepID=UPI002892DCD1|nr:klarsicht protein [Phlebotomus argentipes]XP_059619353.1 klarsicht protein [Phlebotomus argentipes]XP_059619362.1 klarsicht protein [Phlebotomus argentipes]XP_059619371.1 klarsicht protein [Phlebotomus argentipes]XP_059619379.1 klarsicht protein [Phlebotomus argentipes]